MNDTLETLPRLYPRTFVPAGLKVRTLDDVKPLFDALLNAELADAGALEQWLADRTELEAVIGEVGARVHIRTTLDTASAEYKAAFLDWVEKFEPALKQAGDALDRKFAACPARSALDPAKYAIFERGVLTQLELFKPENIPLETELAKLTNQFDETQGAITVEFEGGSYTPVQMNKFLLELDRNLRQRAWQATADARLATHDRLAGLFEKQLRLRERVAINAGLADFREYAWKSMQRFDYTPDDCDAFAHAVERVVLPALRRINQRRAEAMGLAGVRPWDVDVDPHGKPPLKPFDEVESLKLGCSRIFHGVDPALGAQFDRMRELGLLDLANRKGKAPGGYQSTLHEARLPFIFMNAVGLDDDVRTLLHEGGHAFHAFAAADQPLLAYRHAPMEFCEVASMSMELLGSDHLGEFYAPADINRALAEQFERALSLFAMIAQGDQFQHWVYTHIGADAHAVHAQWRAQMQRFATGIEFTGLEKYRDSRWTQIGHFFWVPFYFIEYAIAQIGALQVWLNARKDRKGTLARYRGALALGGSRGLRDLFKAAGLKFGMDYETLSPLVEAVEAELSRLEA
ncbi:MAG: M3 family oligoendopeptidase [Planctomycetes bacterium]|nr:M3 family oligoendopeptidase [Planctomycetota bacterium]MCW8135486.1 M3 family oligoendopeptidase [Planctomycetota bacterium]